ncbi:hypothetical protein PI23P_11502 [Polaribacter irgensii 23-P]|uniref:mannan endo-1,4-beta-mannosidase n=1 Tax=Polaribacter irgensii 23-P TaxID=313594 RepID=A4C1F3_9FLAO|nr:cellulase family glycosylhydrolase [Polaribacter irgensii]EAR11956.1 hypothetical protein PI23P_11502 [Polaribacter irgensii 23-P]
MVTLNKIIFKSILLLSYLLIIAVVLFLISSLYGYLNTGADRSKILHTKIKKIDQYLPKVTWLEDGNLGRKMNAQTLSEIESNYLDAWFVKNSAFQTNSKIGIDAYYTESARKNIFNIIGANKKLKITIERTTLSHNPDIFLFSEDGQLVVLEDKNVVEYKRVFKDNKFILEITEIANYKVILLLEDGFWRIRHLVKESVSDFDKKTNVALPISTSIKGINYYPQATPWNMFGSEFDINIIREDFNLIKNTNLNTIRIFIPYQDFGRAKVKESKLHKLRQVLDAAEKNDLKVIVTLFDFYGNYAVIDWTLNRRHAETIVSAFKNHNALLAWDVKNEPNLDFDSRGKMDVISWLEQIIVLIKSIDKNHAVTIGWSNISSASILKDQLDFVSFHYYEDKDIFEERYIALKKIVKDKPLVLGEFGVTSYRGFWKPFGSSEEKQAMYYKEMQAVFAKNKIPFLSWTLYDFDKIPKEVVGELPWRRNAQEHYGFINKNGEKKKSFEYIFKN